MIVHKFWSAFVAQINKIANLFWEADPIAQMQYEYDKAVEQLKEGRVGLEQYRGLVERVTRQVAGNRSHSQHGCGKRPPRLDGSPAALLFGAPPSAGLHEERCQNGAEQDHLDDAAAGIVPDQYLFDHA